jgi:hypothetical protein
MIRCLRLATGEDIICVVKSGPEIGNSTTTYQIEKVARIQIVSADESGAASIAIVPWIPFATKDQEFWLDEKQVMTTYNPLPQLRNQYNTIFGSGIVIPQVDTRRVLLG